jgi:alkylation response protein AidB-like acyl-CoA dehydrogenase
MVTTAVPEGESTLYNFIVDMRDVPWDGSEGLTLVGAWDGHGMIATQSHGMRFDDFPGIRAAWPDLDARLAEIAVNPVGCMFSSVIVGIVEIALDTARQQLERRRDSLGAFETVEWSRAEMEGWLIKQAYQGMLRELAQGSTRVSRLGKTAIAELSASVLDRLCKILGGSTYARHSPFGYWLQDVRALGYLRPPWPLAFDLVFSGIPHEPETEILTVDSPDSHEHGPVVPETDPARAG